MRKIRVTHVILGFLIGMGVISIILGVASMINLGILLATFEMTFFDLTINDQVVYAILIGIPVNLGITQIIIAWIVKTRATIQSIPLPVEQVLIKESDDPSEKAEELLKQQDEIPD